MDVVSTDVAAAAHAVAVPCASSACTVTAVAGVMSAPAAAAALPGAAANGSVTLASALQRQRRRMWLPSRAVALWCVALIALFSGSGSGIGSGVTPVAATYCPSVLSKYLKTSECPLAADPIARLHKLLEPYHGQTDAIQMVESFFKTNVLIRKKPELLHFSGPTGVGKTYLAKLIGEALFTGRHPDTDKLCGVLTIRLNALMSGIPAAQLRDVQETELLRPIVEQLHHCPRSVIILDDIQFADSAVLEGALKSAFDENDAQLRCSTGSLANRAVSTSHAIFIATSDLEERQTLLQPSLTKKEAIAVIRKLAAERWGSAGSSGGGNGNGNGKANGPAAGSSVVNQQLAHNVIPFLRLSRLDYVHIVTQLFRDVEHLIRVQLKRHSSQSPHYIDWVGHLRLEKALPERVADALKSKTDDYGARAIVHYVDQHVYPQLNDIVMKLLSQAQAQLKKQTFLWYDTQLLIDDIDVVLNPLSNGEPVLLLSSERERNEARDDQQYKEYVQQLQRDQQQRRAAEAAAGSADAAAAAAASRRDAADEL